MHKIKEDIAGVSRDANNDGKKTTLTIVQDFPKKKPDETRVPHVEMVNTNIQTYDVEVIDHQDNQKTVLTIVQDFAKRKAQEGENVEMVQRKSRSRDINFLDNNNKKTTLTIVQDFRKKQAEDITGNELVGIWMY